MVAVLLNIQSNRAINLSNSSACTLVPTPKRLFRHNFSGLPCVMAKYANSLLYHVDATALRDKMCDQMSKIISLTVGQS